MKLIEGRRLPRWLGCILHSIGFPAAHAAAPWALSLLGARHGWTAGKPGPWNLVGLLLVAAGFCILIWSVRSHFTAAPHGWRIEKTPHYPTPAYLLTEGPYRYTRNPIYLAELAIWLGWIVFFGSLVVLGVLAAAAVTVGPVIVRSEERGLEARFGEAWRDYCRATPRWFGKPGS